MKKIVLVLFSALFLFNSCKPIVNTGTDKTDGNPVEKPAGYISVTSDENGLVITTTCEPEYDRNYIQVYDIAESRYNLSINNLSANQVIYYPFVTPGKTYNIEYSLNGSKGYAKGVGLEDYTAQSGLGDIALLCTGFKYDGDKKITVLGEGLVVPENYYEADFQQKLQNPYLGMYLNASTESGYISIPNRDMTFNPETGILEISDNARDNPEYSDIEFHGNFQYGVTYENQKFFAQYYSSDVFKLKEAAGIYFTQNKNFSFRTTSDGLKIVKSYTDNYPNVRIKVYNKTKNHYCPTAILNRNYSNFNYDYVNAGDIYTVEIHLWDSNWSNYSCKKFDDVIPTGGNGDYYFETEGYSYEQGTPDSYDANLVFTNCRFVGNGVPENKTLSGNLYYKEGSKYKSIWQKFDYSFDETKKQLSIDLSSFIRTIRGKTFFTDLAVSWNSNDQGYEINLIYNKENPFTDVHVKLPQNISENYTVLKEYGTCNIDETLQGKTVYLIKYNSNYFEGDDIPVYENKTSKDFDFAIPGKCLGKVADSYSRSASVQTSDYDIGITKKLYGYGNYKNQKERFLYDATLKAKGKHCYVWYANNNDEANKVVNYAINKKTFSFDTLAEKFDAIYDMETALIGPKRVDKVFENIIPVIEEERVNIFVFDLYGDYKKPISENYGVVGYFCGWDLYKKEYQSTSNECQMISVDSVSAAGNPEFMYLTLIHEFQHFLCTINKFYNNDYSSNLNGATWFTELMSEGSEIALQNKCLGFTDCPAENGRASLFNSNYNQGFLDWSSGANYSNASIFAAYLMRNFGGAKLWQEIAYNKYYGEQAITEALHVLGYSEDFDSVMMKMGQMIVDSYDATPAAGSLTLNKEVSSEITDADGNKHTLVLNQFDLKQTEAYEPEDYSSSDRVRFSTAEPLYGPAILKTGSSFSEIQAKAIGVYKLTDKCGSSLELKDPGEGFEMALYFK